MSGDETNRRGGSGQKGRGAKGKASGFDPIRTDRSRPRGAGPSGPRGPGGPRGGGKPRSHSMMRIALEERDTAVLFGLHAVEAALRNAARTLKALYLTENAEHRIQEAVSERGHPVVRVTPRDLDKRLGADTVHQGALLEAEPLAEPALDDLIASSANGPVVVLDQVTDPHNVGAILRSAAAFGACGLILTRRNSPPLSGVLAKSASGALELVPVHLAQNLARAIGVLKGGGLQVIGLDGDAKVQLGACDFTRPTAIVLGAEGKGLRQLTAESCSVLCAIETADALASLNVSNAAAVTLHAALIGRSRQAS